MKERLKNVPLKPGVYLYKDKNEKVIYVGKAKKLRNRMRSYFQSPDGMHPKVRAMMARVADFDYIVTSSELEALILENNLIKAYQPRYNIMLRDDKSYPYLKITAEKYPRLCIVREKKDHSSRYFGPYTEAGALKETKKLLSNLFPLRSCKNMNNKARPCLNYDMGKCLAPCRGQVSEQEYQAIVDSLIKLLEGDTKELLKSKEEEMKQAAAGLNFEKAAQIRDQIHAIKILGEKQKVSLDNDYNIDLIGMINGEKENLLLLFKIRAGKIIAKDSYWLKKAINEDESEMMGFFLKFYYDENPDIPLEILLNTLPEEFELVKECLCEKAGHRVNIKVPERGQKRKLLDMLLENASLLWEEKMQAEQKSAKILEELSRKLDIEVLPDRIECFDISHLAGEETVASMVVFTAGVPDKKAYRRFKISQDQNDDFASMREVLQRRFNEARQGNSSFLPEPDLLIIDGGLGQVNAVKMVLDKMNVDIPVFGLAKKNEEIYRPADSYPIQLSRRDESLMLLQRIRDEAHRFAISYNRQRREKKLSQSALDSIEGVGETRKKALLTHFGSVSKIKEASLDEIQQVPGMNRPVAQRVYEHFNN